MDTFVIRVYRAADEGTAIPDSCTAPLRGLVEHVSTGTIARFGEGQELLRFLQDSPRPGDLGRDEVPAPPDADTQPDRR